MAHERDRVDAVDATADDAHRVVVESVSVHPAVTRKTHLRSAGEVGGLLAVVQQLQVTDGLWQASGAARGVVRREGGLAEQHVAWESVFGHGAGLLGDLGLLAGDIGAAAARGVGGLLTQGRVGLVHVRHSRQQVEYAILAVLRLGDAVQVLLLVDRLRVGVVLDGSAAATRRGSSGFSVGLRGRALSVAVVLSVAKHGLVVAAAKLLAHRASTEKHVQTMLFFHFLGTPSTESVWAGGPCAQYPALPNISAPVTGDSMFRRLGFLGRRVLVSGEEEYECEVEVNRIKCFPVEKEQESYLETTAAKISNSCQALVSFA